MSDKIFRSLAGAIHGAVLRLCPILADTIRKFSTKDLEWLCKVYQDQDVHETDFQDAAGSPTVSNGNFRQNFKSICMACPKVEGCPEGQEHSALAYRINVIAIAKHLLRLPSAHRLKTTESSILDWILNIDNTNFQGFTALDVAAFSGHLDVCSKLLHLLKKADFHLRRASGYISAEESGGAKPADVLQLSNALSCAAWGGNSSVVSLLLENTKDPQMRLAGVGLEIPSRVNDDPPMVMPSDDSEGFEVKFGRKKTAVRSTFLCPAIRESWFEMELVSVGDEPYIGIATKQWNGIQLGGLDPHSFGFSGRSLFDGYKVRLVTNFLDGKVKVFVNDVEDRAQEIKVPVLKDLEGQEVFPAFLGQSAIVRFRFSDLMPATQTIMVEKFSFPADRLQEGEDQQVANSSAHTAFVTARACLVIMSLYLCSFFL